MTVPSASPHTGPDQATLAGEDDLVAAALARRAESDARWRLAVGALPLASFGVRPDGSFESSAELERLCGAPVCSIEGFAAHVVAADREQLVRTLTIPTELACDVSVRVRLRDGAGDARPVHVRAAWGGRRERPHLVGVVVALPDEQLVHMADVAERYRALAETSPDLIVVHQDGVVVYSNPTAQRVMKCSAEEAVGRNPLEFFTPASQRAFMARLATMRDGGSGSTSSVSEEQLVASDGTVVDVEATSILTTWEGRPAYQAICRVITERKAAERQLREQAALIDTVSDAIIAAEGATAADMRVRRWSRGAEVLYGWSEQEVLGRRLGEVLGEDTGDVTSWWNRLLADGAGATERSHITRSGAILPVHVSATVLRNDAGAVTGLIVVTSDISQRKKAEAAQRALEQRFSAVVAALEEGIVVVGTDGRVTSANAAAERILGVGEAELIGTDPSLQGPWRAVDTAGRRLARRAWPHRVTLASGQSVANCVIGLQRNDGTTLWLSVNARPLRDEGEPEALRAVVCSLSDITDAKQARDRLAWAATHDSLTDLINRAGIIEYLEGLGDDDVGGLAVLFVDLDRFKMVNDSLGHSVGDAVLRAVAGRLSESVRSVADVVGRLAGDEFVILCPGLHDTAAAEVIARRLVKLIDEPVEVTDARGNRRSVRIGASIGIAVVQPGEQATEALVDADVAVYAAKQLGRGRVEVFDESLRAAARQRLAIRGDLRTALDQDGFTIAYQPIVSTAGAVHGYEALLRWNHPTRGPISPSEFIPVAEETGLVVPLGAWVLRRAARDAARWRRAGHDAYVSVNLSTRQVADPNLVPMVSRVLAVTGLEAGALVLEITESSVMGDPEAAKVILSQLKALGVSLSIDDFGTGYSSLAYLEQFPVDVLKVDRSFVSVLTSTAEAKLVAGVISLAHLLSLKVVAEGVETEAQADVLRELGADAFQGYLFGRPGPAPA